MPGLGQHILNLSFACAHHFRTVCFVSCNEQHLFLLCICSDDLKPFFVFDSNFRRSQKKIIGTISNMSFELLVTDISKVHCFDVIL